MKFGFARFLPLLLLVGCISPTSESTDQPAATLSLKRPVTLDPTTGRVTLIPTLVLKNTTPTPVMIRSSDLYAVNVQVDFELSDSTGAKLPELAWNPPDSMPAPKTGDKWLRPGESITCFADHAAISEKSDARGTHTKTEYNLLLPERSIKTLPPLTKKGKYRLVAHVRFMDGDRVIYDTYSNAITFTAK